MNRIDRIREMERCLDASRAAVDALTQAFDAYEAVQKDYKKLSDYYGSPQWMKDFEADEAGKLPADLKRGVLSHAMGGTEIKLKSCFKDDIDAGTVFTRELEKHLAYLQKVGTSNVANVKFNFGGDVVDGIDETAENFHEKSLPLLEKFMHECYCYYMGRDIGCQREMSTCFMPRDVFRQEGFHESCGRQKPLRGLRRLRRHVPGGVPHGGGRARRGLSRC